MKRKIREWYLKTFRPKKWAAIVEERKRLWPEMSKFWEREATFLHEKYNSVNYTSMLDLLQGSPDLLISKERKAPQYVMSIDSSGYHNIIYSMIIFDKINHVIQFSLTTHNKKEFDQDVKIMAKRYNISEDQILKEVNQ